MGNPSDLDAAVNELAAELKNIIPRLGLETLRYWTSGKQLEEVLARAFCPVWVLSPSMDSCVVGSSNGVSFCENCKIQQKFCPATHFDVSRISFFSFRRPEGDGFLTAYERIRRLLKTPYVPLSPSMFMSLVKNREKDMNDVMNSALNTGSVVACDGDIYSCLDKISITEHGKNDVWNSLEVPGFKETAYVSTFCFDGAGEERYICRPNKLLHRPSEVVFSVVV